jgi:hypothetical protein
LKLPELGTKEWDAEVRFYANSNIPSRTKRAKELGFASRPSYENRMRENGIYLRAYQSPTPLEEQKDHITYVLPDVTLREYKGHEANGDEEVVVLHCSDGHAGKWTKSFNEEVYKKRMHTMFDSIVEITTLHRHMYPIRKLYIVNTGDNIQGENVHQGSTIGNVKMGAMDQVLKLALPCWVDLVLSLRQHFEEIEIHCFMGNHGKYSKEAPETSNWDLMLYNAMKVTLERDPGIKVNVYEEFSDIVDIEGFKFFCFHGDDIPCSQGVPFFAIDKKLKSWFVQYGGFNYALGGHFHKRHSDEIASKFEYFMCGSLVSDDEWALKKLGISSNPSQWVFGVHPRMGITWRYALCVDRDFMPEKIK